MGKHVLQEESHYRNALYQTRTANPDRPPLAPALLAPLHTCGQPLGFRSEWRELYVSHHWCVYLRSGLRHLLLCEPSYKMGTITLELAPCHPNSKDGNDVKVWSWALTLYHIIKINSKWIKGLDLRSKNYKLPRGKYRRKSSWHHIWQCFLEYDTKNIVKNKNKKR